MATNIRWWLKPEFYRGVAVVGTGILFTWDHVPNYFLINKYRKMVQLYRHTQPVPVAESVKTRIKTVMNDMNLSKYKMALIDCFTVFGFDMFYCGSTLLNRGAVIGIPCSFGCETTKDLDTGSILVSNQVPVTNFDDSNTLLESLIFSDSAQKFAIARQISHVQFPFVYIKGLGSAGVMGTVTGLVFGIHNKLQKVRGYSLVPIAFISYVFICLPLLLLCRDGLNCHYEVKADMKAASLGLDYARGGVEFYDKLIQRNKCLRAMRGADGEKQYTIYGNDTVFIRRKHVEFTQRRDVVKKILESMGEAEQQQEHIPEQETKEE